MTFERLTEREAEALALIARGLSNRAIAEQLTLERSTVRWYAHQIYAKLGVDGREAAAARARALGLLPETEQPALPRGTLPWSATPFLGRQGLLAHLDSLLRDPMVRLITIVGPGGIGKTRLPLAVAERQLMPHVDAGGRLADRFPGGVWFIPLVAVSSAAHLAPSIASALGLPLESTARRDPQQQLLDFLHHKQALLILDNVEQRVEASALLSELVAGTAARLLVTSRGRLQAEHGVPIEGWRCRSRRRHSNASECGCIRSCSTRCTR